MAATRYREVCLPESTLHDGDVGAVGRVGDLLLQFRPSASVPRRLRLGSSSSSSGGESGTRTSGVLPATGPGISRVLKKIPARA